MDDPSDGYWVQFTGVTSTSMHVPQAVGYNWNENGDLFFYDEDSVTIHSFAKGIWAMVTPAKYMEVEGDDYGL